MGLTEQQIAFFRTFGFLKFPGLLADQIGQIEAAFEGVWDEHGGGHGGKPHDGQARSCLVPFIDQSERLCQLIDHPAIIGIASSLLRSSITRRSVVPERPTPRMITGGAIAAGA